MAQEAATRPLYNSKHEIVAQQLAQGKTIAEAMQAAGYGPEVSSPVGGRRIGRLIRYRVVYLQKQMIEARLVTSAKLHERWSEVFEADIADIMTDVGGFKPITEWPKIWRQMLSGVDVKELFERSTDGEASSWDRIGQLVKIKFVSMKDAAEVLGRLKRVDAFVSRVEEKHEHLHLHLNEVRAKVQEARERLIRAANPPAEEHIHGKH